MTRYYMNIVKLYSGAFFELVIGRDDFKSISTEVTNLREVLLQDQSILAIVSAPIYSDQEQSELVDKLVEQLNLSEMTTNLLTILAQNKRLEQLIDILSYFEIIRSENFGYKNVEVTVSYELSAVEKDKLQKRLEQALDSKIQLSLKIDPQILGGLVIKVDNQMLDASLKKSFNYLSSDVQEQIAFL